MHKSESFKSLFRGALVFLLISALLLGCSAADSTDLTDAQSTSEAEEEYADAGTESKTEEGYADAGTESETEEEQAAEAADVGANDAAADDADTGEEEAAESGDNGGTADTGEEETAESGDGGEETEDIPEYDGDPYVELADDEPEFTADELTDESYEEYSELDELGRCQAAIACIGTDLMPDEERESISSVTPTGWINKQYDSVDGGYLYNRCHLIGYQLTGENANEENLITGTRYMNVEGMLPFENEVAEYIEDTENHVLYRVTPYYEGDNLVASGVQMEAYSVEDDGEGICFNVYVYNVQPYIVIDYATGESWETEELYEAEGTWAAGTAAEGEYEDDADGSSGTSTADSSGSSTDADGSDSSSSGGSSSDSSSNASSSSGSSSGSGSDASSDSTSDSSGSETSSADDAETTYILNTNTMKFHLPDCSSVDDMAEKNKETYTGDRQTLIDSGYDPCGRCNP